MQQTVLLLDGSEAMNSSADYLPNYLLAMRPPLLQFVARYLDSTPLASLGVVVMRDGISHRLLPCTTNQSEVLDILERDYFLHGGSGATSVENGLRMAMSVLVNLQKVIGLSASLETRAVAEEDKKNKKKTAVVHRQRPSSATRLRVVLLSASVTLIDPTDVFAVIRSMAALDIVIDVVSLVGAVHVFEACATQTGGRLYCPLNYSHLLTISAELAIWRDGGSGREGYHRRRPRSSFGADAEAEPREPPRLIPIGVPVYITAPASLGAEKVYLACPQCHLLQLSIPTTCPLCRLLLCNAAMLYRTYILHHRLVPAAQQVRVDAGGRDPAAMTAPRLALKGPATEVKEEVGVSSRASPSKPSVIHAAPGTDSSPVPMRCSLCMMAVKQRGGDGAPSSTLWQCSACRSYRCTPCHRFVEESLGLCPHCIAMQ